MSFVQLFFIANFAAAGACIAHRFIHSHELSVPELLTKFLSGAVGAFLAPTVLGHWWLAVEGVWFAPEVVGAFLGAVCAAILWTFFAHRAIVHAGHGEPKPVMH